MQFMLLVILQGGTKTHTIIFWDTEQLLVFVCSMWHRFKRIAVIIFSQNVLMLQCCVCLLPSSVHLYGMYCG